MIIKQIKILKITIKVPRTKYYNNKYKIYRKKWLVKKDNNINTRIFNYNNK